MKRIIKTIALALLGATMALSCTKLEVRMPQGPQGEQGIPGRDGLSAYEVWVKAVKDGTIPGYDGGTEINDFFIYLKGKDGKDGLSAYEIWKISVTEGIEDPKNPGQEWPKDKTEIVHFYEFLTGKDGDDGKTPYIGENGNWYIGGEDTGLKAQGPKGDTGATGAAGQDGKSAYEIWKEIAATGNMDDPKNPGQKWPKEKVTVENFFEYLSGVDGKDGKDGKDGLTPHVGDNGNWFIGTTDTRVPAKGADGKDGNTPTVGGNGNWYIGGNDTGVPAKGKDGANGANGKDGLSAYELWKKDVTSAAGLEDPHNPGTIWDKTKTTMADFWLYLQGANGKDGKDGKSSYELWKEIVDQGKMDNPKTDDETDFWPVENNTIEWFWEYLKGKDGKDGTNIIVVGADKTKFNLVPMPAVNYNGTDEYVNPFSGGVTYRACAPNYVILANCQVEVTLPGGTKKTYTTDINGYVHMPVTDLPEWSEGSTPGGISVKPDRFTLSDGTVIDDSNNIAQTCKIPDRVRIEIKTVVSDDSPELCINNLGSFSEKSGSVRMAYEIYRTVEGVSSEINFASMKYYILNGTKTVDMTTAGKKGVGFNTTTSGYPKKNVDDGNVYIQRLDRTYNVNLDYGNGVTGPAINYANNVGTNSWGEWLNGWIADYGDKNEDETIVEVPLINDMGTFLKKVGKGDITKYLLFVGYADFMFVLDKTTFGGLYVNYNADNAHTGSAARQDADGIYKFKYFPSLVKFMQDPDYWSTQTAFIKSSLRNYGKFNGTSIDNTIDFNAEAFNPSNPVVIKNVYNDFELDFGDFVSRDNVLYKGKYGSFKTDMTLGIDSKVIWNNNEEINIPTKPGE